MRNRALRADMLLLIAAAIWGSGFIAQRAAMENVGPWAFNAARYAIGAMMVLPFVLLSGRRRASLQRGLWRDGVLLGLVLALGAGLQQIGMVTTTASRAGFLTGLYVLLVPVIGLAMRERPRLGHVVGLALAAVGLFLFRPDLGGGWVVGDLFVLAGACVWALHVVMAGVTSRRSDPVLLACVQFSVAAVASALVMLPLEAPSVNGLVAVIDGARDAWLPIAFSGILATGVAFTLQLVAQRDAPPTHAAVLMSLEAVFAALFGWMLLNESLGPGELLGGGFILAGMIASQLLGREKGEGDPPTTADPVPAP